MSNRWDHVPLKPCGTVAAYRRHLRRREVPCDACLAACRLDQAARRTVGQLVAVVAESLREAS